MIRVWNIVLRPLATAAGARTILEVGSESGLSSRVLLNFVKEASGHLYSVDTNPDFDTGALEADFPGLASFIRGASLDVIPTLPALDLVLLDGDHNWYTVHGELQALERAHEGAQMPVVAVHDSEWPYGRRDLYYDPPTVPQEYRHPFSQAPLPLPGAKVARGGGINAGMNNCEHEGGARNGVMTAIEDYVRDSTHTWQVLHLPMYFGVTIMLPRERLGGSDALQAYASWLENQLQGRELIALCERLRLAETIQAQALHEALDNAHARIRELEQQLGTAPLRDTPP